MKAIENNIDSETIPLWLRIPIFILFTPVIMALTAVAMVLTSFVIVIGTFVVMVEFLVWGGLKTDKTFEETIDRNKENKNENTEQNEKNS